MLAGARGPWKLLDPLELLELELELLPFLPMFGQLALLYGVVLPDESLGAGVAVPPAELVGAVVGVVAVLVAAGVAVGASVAVCAELTAPVARRAPTASATIAIPLRAHV